MGHYFRWSFNVLEWNENSKEPMTCRTNRHCNCQWSQPLDEPTALHHVVERISFHFQPYYMLLALPLITIIFFFAVLRCLSRCYCNSAMAILARFCEQRLAWNIRPSCCASIYRDDYSPPCFVYINFRLEKKNIPCGKFEITWVGYGQPQMHIECREQDNCDRNIAATDHIIMSQHEKALKAM